MSSATRMSRSGGRTRGKEKANKFLGIGMFSVCFLCAFNIYVFLFRCADQEVDTTVPVPLARPVGLADDDTEEEVLEEEPPQEVGHKNDVGVHHFQDIVLINFL